MSPPNYGFHGEANLHVPNRITSEHLEEIERKLTQFKIDLKLNSVHESEQMLNEVETIFEHEESLEDALKQAEDLRKLKLFRMLQNAFDQKTEISYNIFHNEESILLVRPQLEEIFREWYGLKAELSIKHTTRESLDNQIEAIDALFKAEKSLQVTLVQAERLRKLKLLRLLLEVRLNRTVRSNEMYQTQKLEHDRPITESSVFELKMHILNAQCRALQIASQQDLQIMKRELEIVHQECKVKEKKILSLQANIQIINKENAKLAYKNASNSADIEIITLTMNTQITAQEKLKEEIEQLKTLTEQQAQALTTQQAQALTVQQAQALAAQQAQALAVQQAQALAAQQAQALATQQAAAHQEMMKALTKQQAAAQQEMMKALAKKQEQMLRSLGIQPPAEAIAQTENTFFGSLRKASGCIIS